MELLGGFVSEIHFVEDRGSADVAQWQEETHKLLVTAKTSTIALMALEKYHATILHTVRSTEDNCFVAACRVTGQSLTEYQPHSNEQSLDELHAAADRKAVGLLAKYVDLHNETDRQTPEITNLIQKTNSFFSQCDFETPTISCLRNNLRCISFTWRLSLAGYYRTAKRIVSATTAA